MEELTNTRSWNQANNLLSVRGGNELLENVTNRAVGAKVRPPDFLSIFSLLKQSKTEKNSIR